MRTRRKPINRREFLRLSALGAAGVVLTACAKKTTVEAPPPAILPTKTVPQSTPTPTVAPATPTPIPTLAATATAIPTIAAFRYKEAPMLADLVSAGKLPPLEQRLPKNPLVLSPVDTIGKYGGRWRTFYNSWVGYFQEQQYGHSPLRWIDDGMGIAPGMCEAWETNADNTVWTLHFREGLKWSDGQLCTVDDVLFWWNDLSQISDPSYPDPIPSFGQDATGKMAKLTKVDEYTLTISYTTPAPLTARRLAMMVKVIPIGDRWIAPAHYLKQFLPKYNPAEKDFNDFGTYADTSTNPDLPTLNAWVVTRYDAGKTMSADRNPYYYAIDTEGNQLPYIDGQDWTSVQDAQVELLMVRQGSIDHVHFHDFTLADIPTLQADAEAGGYEVYLWDSGSGTGMMYFWNHDARDDKIRALYRTPAFKQAMSHAIDRPTIQKVVYYNTGILTTGTMSPKAFEFNFNADAQAYYTKARDAFVEYNPDKARTMLDGIGCKVGPDGHRTFPDGSPYTLRIDLWAGTSKECLSVLEITKKNWEDVGFDVVVNQVTPAAYSSEWSSGNLQISSDWEVGDGPDHLLYPSWIVPNDPYRWAPLCGNKLAYEGTPSENSEADTSPWDRKPPRFNSNDPDYKGTPIEKIHQIYKQAIVEIDEVKRAQLVYQMWDIHMSDGPYFIGVVANYPRIIIKSARMTNVPRKDQLKLGGFVNPWIIPYPAVVNTETWSFTQV
jgi:peptide/nickel transport system substrate-binding protein